jgi:PAS domain S-box-containing protein
MTTLDDVTTCAGQPLVPAPGAPGACLILISTAMPASIGKTFRLQPGEHVLGRGSEVEIRIDDHGVSRRHARIIRTPDGTCHVTDLGSTNGTYLNGVSIASAELREGDRLQIGTGTIFRYSAREQLEPREEQLRQALSAARVGIWDWSAVSGVVTWSEHVDRLLGLTVGKLSGRAMDLAEIIHPADLTRVREALAAALEQRTQVELEYRIEPAGSGCRWLCCKGDVLCDAAGTPARITGTVMDITARKQAEQELRRQALLFENFYDGVVVADLAGRILDFNPSAERMFGHGKADAVGLTLFSLLHPGELDSLTSVIQDALERTGRWTGEVEFRRRDGTACSCECVMVPLRDTEGRAIASVMVLRDITERKHLQARLVMADRLASLGTLGAGVAHEINNPLAYMLVNLHLLRTGLEQLKDFTPVSVLEPLGQLVQETTEGAERIAGIVRDLKTFARGEQDSRLGPVDARRAVELACKMADNMLRHRARLKLEFDAVPQVEANEARLGQVFLNLLLNAAQAIPEGEPAERHQITVRLRAGSPGQVVVEVRDTGVGMTPEVLSRVFDPFFTTKAVGEGTGLGLSICHGIVESMGGAISAESKPGQGSTFRVLLRTASADSGNLTRPTLRLPVPAVQPVPVESPRARVLVVDDEPHVTTALQRALGSEHEISTAHNARDALRMLEQDRRFDVILCDVMMPGMTGMDLYAELGRASPDMAGRVVFMTGGAFTPRAVTFLREVPNQKIGKPLNLEELRMLVTQRAVEARR